MQCVGKSIISHAYLKELGIPHQACLSQNHIAIMVQLQGKEWYFDGTSSPASLLPNAAQEKNGTTYLSSNVYSNGKPLEYELTGAEEGCYFAMMLNVINGSSISPAGKIPIIKAQIRGQLPNPAPGYFLLLAEAYSRTGDATQALRCIEEERRLHPWNKHIEQSVAEIHEANGDYVNAYLRYLNVPDKEPKIVQKVQECYGKIGFQCQSDLSEEATRYSKWITKRRKATIAQIYKWIDLDPTNREAWRCLWLKSEGENSFAPYQVMQFLSDGEKFVGSPNLRKPALEDSERIIRWLIEQNYAKISDFIRSNFKEKA